MAHSGLFSIHMRIFPQGLVHSLCNLFCYALLLSTSTSCQTTETLSFNKHTIPHYEDTTLKDPLMGAGAQTQ